MSAISSARLCSISAHAKVAILSVTEGDDKPLKYPHMFRAARLMLLNKIDLPPQKDFDVDAAIGNARSVNPGIIVKCVSARTGEGLDALYDWIRDAATDARRTACKVEFPDPTRPIRKG